MNVSESTVIERPAADVWAIVRDFIGLTAWSNAVSEARINNNLAADQVGAIRELKVGEAIFVETLVTRSDQAMTLQYDIVQGPLPVTNYLATMRVQAITASDTSFVSWGAQFDTPPDQIDAMQEVVGGQICAGGLAALKAWCEAR